MHGSKGQQAHQHCRHFASSLHADLDMVVTLDMYGGDGVLRFAARFVG